MQFDELLSLCKDVIPITWNVYKHHEEDNCKMERGILNIELDVRDIPQNKIIKPEGFASPIRYWDGIATTGIVIQSITIIRSIVLIHELCHIAVYRLESFRTKSHIKSYYEKKIYNNEGSKIESTCQHGKIFRSFLNIIENRANKRGWKAGSTIYENKTIRIWQKP